MTVLLRIETDKKQIQIITPLRIIDNILTIPISSTDIKGKLEKELETKFAIFIRFIPKKNHAKNSKIIARIRKV